MEVAAVFGVGLESRCNVKRLQILLAQAGVGSRRACEVMIAAGRVSVNGCVATTGCKANESDVICVDGQRISGREFLIYMMLNKPKGVVTTVKDPQGRPTVIDLLRSVEQRIYPVGRLDADTTGLLLLTNDGEWANQLMHPRYHVPKTYEIWMEGDLSKDAVQRLEQGVQLDDGMTAPAVVKNVNRMKSSTRLLLTIREGRKRQVRRMCSALGHKVLALSRVEYGPLKLGELQSGQWRMLNRSEIQSLFTNCSRD